MAAKRKRLKTLNKIEELPLTCDLSRLTSHLKEKLKRCQEMELVDCAKHCLVFLILFNKRRPFEVAEIKVSNYLAEINRKIEDHTEIMNCLDESEKILAQR